MKKVLNVLGIIVAVILIPIIIIFELGLGVKLSIDNTLQMDKYDEAMEEIDIATFFHDENGNEVELGKRIYAYFDTIGLTKEEVDKVVVDKRFKKIIGRFLGTMFINGIGGAEVVYPSQKELVDFIKANYESFKNVSGVEQEYRQKNIEEVVANNYANVKRELDELKDSINFDEIENIEYLRQIMSKDFKKQIIISLVAIIGLLLLVRWSYYRWMVWFSIPTMTSGILLLIFGLLTSFLGGSISFTSADGTISTDFISSLVMAMYKNFTTTVYVTSGVLIVVSIVLFILHGILKKNATENKEVEAKIESSL